MPQTNKTKSARRRDSKKRRKERSLVSKTAKPGRQNIASGFTPSGKQQLRRAQGALGSLARVITLPSDAKPVRFPTTTLGAHKTAVWHVMANVQNTYGSSVVSPNQVFMLSHSPLCPVWGYKTKASGYSLNFTPTVPSGATSDMHLVANVFSDSDPVPCYPLKYDGKYWLYIPTGVSFSVFITGLSGAGACVMSYSVITRFGESNDYVATFTTNAGGTASFAISPLGASKWVTLNNVDIGALTTTGTTGFKIDSINTLTGFWPIIKGPAIDDLTTPLENLRVNSAGLLVQNISAPLYRNGGVNAAILYYDETNVFQPADCKTKISTVNEALRFTGKAETGAYTYLIPSEASMNFTSYVSVPPGASSGAATILCQDLADYRDVNYITFDVDTSASNFVTNLRLDIHYESITNSQIFNLGVPLIPYDEFVAVVTAASTLVPFTENPLHHVLMQLGTKVLKNITPYLLPYAHNAVDSLAARIATL